MGMCIDGSAVAAMSVLMTGHGDIALKTKDYYPRDLIHLTYTMTNKKKRQTKKTQQAQRPQPNGIKYDHCLLLNPLLTFISRKNAAPTQTSPTPEPTTSVSPSAPDSVPVSRQENSAAEEVKERGNVAFKAKQYTEAIDLYTKAIGTIPHPAPHPISLINNILDMKPTEPSYLTNRAASYMALKRFRPALSDCQQAAILQSAEPSSKTLIRLARCQLALGLSEPALTTLRSVLAFEPNNAAALQLNEKVLELGSHLRTFESARGRKEWGMARLALDKCLQSIEVEDDEIPTQWRLWRVELDHLSRGNWDPVNIATNITAK